MLMFDFIGEQSLENGGAAVHLALRKAYEGLLKEFPLCYGYWHKLAELEKARDKSMASAAAVYERGLAAVKCWELYLKFCSCAAQQCGTPEQIRDFNARQDAEEQSAGQWRVGVGEEGSREGERMETWTLICSSSQHELQTEPERPKRPSEGRRRCVRRPPGGVKGPAEGPERPGRPRRGRSGGFGILPTWFRDRNDVTKIPRPS